MPGQDCIWLDHGANLFQCLLTEDLAKLRESNPLIAEAELGAAAASDQSVKGFRQPIDAAARG